MVGDNKIRHQRGFNFMDNWGRYFAKDYKDSISFYGGLTKGSTNKATETKERKQPTSEPMMNNDKKFAKMIKFEPAPQKFPDFPLNFPFENTNFDF